MFTLRDQQLKGHRIISRLLVLTIELVVVYQQLVPNLEQASSLSTHSFEVGVKRFCVLKFGTEYWADGRISEL